MPQPDGSLLVKGGRVLDLARDPHDPEIADIWVRDGAIAAITAADSTAPGPAKDVTVIDAAGKLVVPGFVNAHYHSHDVFLKGCFDTTNLEFWAINALPRNYPPRSDDEIRVRTLLGAAECLRGGITTIQDMLTLFPLTPAQVEIVRAAYAEAGLRVVLGLQIADVPPLATVPYWREAIPSDLHPLLAGPPPPAGTPDPLDAAEEVFRRGPEAGSLIRWAVCPSSPERCSPALLERLVDMAQRHDLPLCSHIYISRAEALNARRAFGAHAGSMVSYLAEAGALGPRMTLAHGVWLDRAEIDMLAASGTNVAINPLSNLKTKNGAAPIRALIEAGVNLALGCDNCSCSDAQNIFQAMKLFTFIAAISDPREGPPDAVDALRAAGQGGARALGLDAGIGALRPGMRADLVLLDAADPVYLPFNSAARQIVYGEGGRGVETVIIDGRVVMQDRRLTTIDEAALRAELASLMPGFRRDAKQVFERARRLRPYILDADRRIWEHDLGFSRFVAG